MHQVIQCVSAHEIELSVVVRVELIFLSLFFEEKHNYLLKIYISLYPGYISLSSAVQYDVSERRNGKLVIFFVFFELVKVFVNKHINSFLFRWF